MLVSFVYEAPISTMEFGKLSSLERVEFALPPDPTENRLLLQQNPLSLGQKPRLWLASPVWSDPGFVGKIYPEKTKKADYLYHYSRQFNAIELNTTWYGVHPVHLNKWFAAAPDDFRFCPKLPQQITHRLQLREAREATRDFCSRIMAFEHKLGPVWGVLPASFGPERTEVVDRWLQQFPPSIPVGLEFRHPEWFSHETNRKAWARIMQKHRAIAIITDVAGRRDVLHMHLTAPVSILRFVGNRHHPTDFSRLDDWAVRMADWYRNGLHEAYVFFHQPEEHLTVENAIYFAQKLTRLVDLEVRIPRLPDQQMRLF